MKTLLVFLSVLIFTCVPTHADNAPISKLDFALLSSDVAAAKYAAEDALNATLTSQSLALQQEFEAKFLKKLIMDGDGPKDSKGQTRLRELKKEWKDYFAKEKMVIVNDPYFDSICTLLSLIELKQEAATTSSQ